MGDFGEVWLLVGFLLVAVCYASVGFGGGSSYTAILAWRGESAEVIRWTSLSCNLVVAAVGGWASLRWGRVRLAMLGPLLVASVPTVWWAAGWELPREDFLAVLGWALVAAGGLLVFGGKRKPGGILADRRRRWLWLLGLGAVLGILAGVTGIGGGIYLVPTLLLLRVGEEREVAAVGTWFILVNSAVGLVRVPRPGELGDWGWLPLVVFVGGVVGAVLLQGVLKAEWVKRWTGVLVLGVGMRVLWV